MHLQPIFSGVGFAQNKALGCIMKPAESRRVDRRKISEGDDINAILE